MIDRVGNRREYDYPVVNERKLNSQAESTEKFHPDYLKEGAVYEPSKEAKGLLEASVQNDGKSFFDMAKETIQKVIGTVKEFFISIWREEKNVEDTVIDTVIDTGEDVGIPKKQSRFELAKAEAQKFLASEEGKKAVRNSDLLTRYDRHATVVNLSPSDRQRILYGDKNQLNI